jgi:oligopeptide transport system permease protein
MMRIVDVLYALPFIFFVIMLVVFFGRNFVLMFLAVGAVLNGSTWRASCAARRCRSAGRNMSRRPRPWASASAASCCATSSPTCSARWSIYMTLLVPQVIILESFLSFLGLGVQEPMTSWGVLISVGAKNIGTANWLLLFPAFFLVSTLFALNFVGDGLRDALDPRDR